MPELEWFEGYSGESVDQLLELEGRYRIDSVVLAFEQAMDQKASKVGSEALTREERTILAVEALEREVNNGGYSQFFVNSSNEYADAIADSLERIGCPATAEITRSALAAVAGISRPAGEVKDGLWEVNEECAVALAECDTRYFAGTENIAQQLFNFIKANKAGIEA